MYAYAHQRRRYYDPSSSPGVVQSAPRTELPLEGGNIYYAVVDAEALVIGRVINIVEQIAFVLYDVDGVEVWAEKHFIEQPHDAPTLAAMYGVDRDVVDRAIDGYLMITGDTDYVHNSSVGHERWADVRKHIHRVFHHHAARVYAKGPALETSVFYGAVQITDLASFGCPKYPLHPHDPLKECRFFAQFIPEIRCRTYQMAYMPFWTS
jgi:hypothetical protein